MQNKNRRNVGRVERTRGNLEDGITLIALIITIVVMLILVAVSIQLVINSGLIDSTKNAGKGIEYKAKEESTLGNEIEIDGKKYASIEDYVKEKELINWEQIIADANANPNKYKHTEQTTSEYIAIGTDGKPVNMDLWNNPELSNGTFDLVGVQEYVGGGNYVYAQPGYKGTFTADGKIEGKIPEYIYNSEQGNFLKVTGMTYTFCNCTSLRIASEIPTSVTTMDNTFYGCTSLNIAPVIPSGVTYMNGTFSGCSDLVDTPKIPASVTSMNSTFSDCSGLVDTPEIPASVTSMDGTFSGCSSLVDTPEIPASVASMNGTFSGCSSLVDTPEIPASVTSMSGTFSGCSNLVDAPEIPKNVTNMNSTFFRMHKSDLPASNSSRGVRNVLYFLRLHRIKDGA